MRSIGFEHSAVLILLCAWPGLALAEGSPNIEAGQHFERGLALAKQKAYPEAIVEFNRAYEISPHFTVMYNLGQAYIAIEQPVYAVEALRRYLVEGGAEVQASRRRQVEDTISEQERRIASLTLRAEVAGVAVRIDGNEIGRTPVGAPIRIAAGPHVIDASAPGYKNWEMRLSLSGREQRTIDIRLDPAPVVAASATPVVPAAPVVSATPLPVEPSPAPASPPGPVEVSPAAVAPVASSTEGTTPRAASRRGRTIAALIVGAVGVGAIATGSVFGLHAFSKKSDSDEQCPNEQCSVDGERLNDEAKEAATISTISFGAGIVAVGVATCLLLRTGSSRASEVGGTTTAVQVTPTIASGQAGLTLRGVW